jgi:hypothetical protein
VEKLNLVLELIGAIAVISRIVTLFLPEGPTKEKLLHLSFSVDKALGKKPEKPAEALSEKDMVELLKAKK